MKTSAIAIASTTFLLAAVLPAAAANFVSTDANGDGVVTLQEAQAVMPEVTEEMFVSADADGDGALNEQEFLTISS